MKHECNLEETLKHIETLDKQDVRSDIMLLLLEAINNFTDKGVRFPVYISKQLRYYVSKKFGRLRPQLKPDSLNQQEFYVMDPLTRIAIKELNGTCQLFLLRAMGLPILSIRKLGGFNTNNLVRIFKEKKEELFNVQ